MTNVVENKPVVSVVIPTRGRPGYLDVALASVTPQAAAEAEVVVVDDGADPATEAVTARYPVRVVSLRDARGVNGARNAGIREARGDLIVLLDDDVQSRPAGSTRCSMVFARRTTVRCSAVRSKPGSRAAHSGRADGSPHRSRHTILVPKTAMCSRSVVATHERVGYFDEALSGSGDEEEWVRRYTASGGRIRYLAAANLFHRRSKADAKLAALVRAAYRRGREARRHDARVDRNRSIRADVRVLAGCTWHTVRRRCAYGIVMGARAAGSLHEGLTGRWRRTTAEPRVAQ